MDLTQLKEELDSTLLQYFEVLDQFYQAQARLESQMSSGLINMSRARYNIGVKAVSISQIHEDNMVASVKVCSSPSPDSDSSQTVFKLVDGNDKGDETTEKASSKKKSELKQRKGKGEEPHQKSPVEDVGSVKRVEKEGQEQEVDKEEKMKQGGNGIVDPLRWFGVLVPQALRQSQADFKKAVESVVEVANLKQQLMSLSSTYRQLLGKKADCKADNTDCQE